MTTDWEKLRAHKWSPVPPPPDWPVHVRPISMNGLGLFGIDSKTHSLHFDGDKLVTERRLARFERLCLGIGTASAFVIALIEIGRALGVISTG